MGPEMERGPRKQQVRRHDGKMATLREEEHRTTGGSDLMGSQAGGDLRGCEKDAEYFPGVSSVHGQAPG